MVAVPGLFESLGAVGKRISRFDTTETGSYALRVTAKGLSWDAGPEHAAGRRLLDHTFDA